MRCVQGETLESVIERLAAGDPLAHAQWTFERRVHVFRQLLDAVAFAHERGFVHRDIKPANVMVGPLRRGVPHGLGHRQARRRARPPRGTEVDAARQPAAASPPTHAGAIVGTPAYMSPEQARGEPVDARSDVYSLSVLLHELLGLKHYLDHCTTVEAVLDGVQHAHAPAPELHAEPAPAARAHGARRGSCARASRRTRRSRYQSVREMIERLDAREEGLIPIQCPVTLTKRTVRERLRFVDHHPMLFTAALSVFIVAGIGLAVWRFF